MRPCACVCVCVYLTHGRLVVDGFMRDLKLIKKVHALTSAEACEISLKCKLL